MLTTMITPVRVSEPPLYVRNIIILFLLLYYYIIYIKHYIIKQPVSENRHWLLFIRIHIWIQASRPVIVYQQTEQLQWTVVLNTQYAKTIVISWVPMLYTRQYVWVSRFLGNGHNKLSHLVWHATEPSLFKGHDS